MTFSKHSAIISAFGKHFVKSGELPKEFHRFLLDGFDRRNVSDYDVRADFSKEEADEQIFRVEKFLTLAENKIGKIPTTN